MEGRTQNKDRILAERRAAVLAGIALRRHGLCRARLTPLRGGFKQVFRVEDSSRGVFALRVYPEPPASGRVQRSDARWRTGPGLRSPETLRAQLAWLESLRAEEGLPVPEPVPLSDGTLIGHASFDDLPRRLRLLRRVSAGHRVLYRPDHPGCYFALLRWVPGEPGRKGCLIPEEARRIGSFVARLHEHAASYQPPDTSAFPRWDWHWPFGVSAPIWNLGEQFYTAAQMELFDEASSRARLILERLGYASGTFGVVHRDLNLGNLLFENGSVGATDFDLCGLAHYPFDLSVVLRDVSRVLPGRDHGKRRRRLREALLEGYASVRSLPDPWRKSLKTFNAMQSVAAVNRTLELRASPTTRHQARGESFLSGVVRWLESDYLG